MLVLTRKVEQKLQIGPNITVTVLRIKGRAVKIGVEAPQGVHVLRTELLGQSCARDLPGPSSERSKEADAIDPAPPRQSAHTPGDAPSDEEIDPSCASPSGPFLPKRRALRPALASQDRITPGAGPALSGGSPRNSEGDSPIFAARELGQSPGCLSADPWLAV